MPLVVHRINEISANAHDEDYSEPFAVIVPMDGE